MVSTLDRGDDPQEYEAATCKSDVRISFHLLSCGGIECTPRCIA
jgi:hypothetical protein